MSLESDLNQVIGNRVNDLRTKRGITQGQLATRLANMGMPLAQQTIAKIENGTRPLKLAEAKAFSEILAVSVNQLVEGDQEFFALQQEVSHFLNTLGAVGNSVRQMYPLQRSARDTWAEASDDTRSRYLDVAILDERTLTWFLNAPIGELLTRDGPDGARHGEPIPKNLWERYGIESPIRGSHDPTSE